MNDLQNFDAKKKFIHLNVGIESKLQVSVFIMGGERGAGVNLISIEICQTLT